MKKSDIKSVIWNVPGVAEGVCHTIREAKAAIAEERRRVGHVRARITIDRGYKRERRSV